MHSKHPRFRKPDPAMEKEIDGILASMTLEEKIDMLGGCKVWGQEEGNTISCKRVGIPSIRMADASVGVHWWIHETTTFPASIALAASFNTDLAARYAKAIARDCLAGGIHILLGPGINLYRSPLCGRNFEYFGEDPCLSSRMAVAYVRALQDQGVAATLKHYAVNYQEFDRNKVSSDLDERTLREVYLQAFEAGVGEGGAACIMTAYNLVNGVHCAENSHLIREILKGDWGFDGIVMSDWVSVYDALNTANAGLDLEMPWAKWMNREYLVPAVQDGRLSLSVIDDKIRRLVRLIKAFGWDTHPQKQDAPGRNVENAAVSLEVACEGMVLLKNEGILPLDFSKIRKLAVIGPNADPAIVCGGGSAHNPGWRTVSFLDGIREEARQSGTQVVHAPGVDPHRGLKVCGASDFLAPDGSKGLSVAYHANRNLEGQPVLVRNETLINHEWREKPILTDHALDKENFSIRFSARIRIDEPGDYRFHFFVWDGALRLRVGDKVIFDTWGREAFGDHQVVARLEAGLQDYVLEFQNIRGWNSCCAGWEPASRQVEEYQAALRIAGEADGVIFCGGFTNRSEGEGSDRDFAMPEDVEALLMDVLERNTNTVMVLTSGGNVDMEKWHSKVKALLQVWYPGQEGGTALARILSGRVNPSARLPATFETRLEDRSSHESYQDSDHDLRVELKDGVFGGYRHVDRSGILPRYAFGFGLSYTTFAWSDFSLSHSHITLAQDLEITLSVSNTGVLAGAEVVQVYVSPPDCLVPRPVKELKAFAKCFLQAGEKQSLQMTLKPGDFAYWSLEHSAWLVDAGEYQIHLAKSSLDIVGTLTVHIEESSLIRPME